MKSGRLFLIVGPSGVGKGTLVDQLRVRHPEFYFPPSVTTRMPRAGEQDGEQYLFFSPEKFSEIERAEKFLETAVVHSAQKYGTLKEPILDAIAEGKIVIREVDIQGLILIRQKLSSQKFTAIFISPPDFETLQKRILQRQPQISKAELARRLLSANQEIAQKNFADFEIINEENSVEKMVTQVEKLIQNQISS